MLVSGNHRLIRLWKLEEALKLTREARPDLLEEFVMKAEELPKDEQKVIGKNIKMM